MPLFTSLSQANKTVPGKWQTALVFVEQMNGHVTFPEWLYVTESCIMAILYRQKNKVLIQLDFYLKTLGLTTELVFIKFGPNSSTSLRKTASFT